MACKPSAKTIAKACIIGVIILAHLASTIRAEVTQSRLERWPLCWVESQSRDLPLYPKYSDFIRSIHSREIRHKVPSLVEWCTATHSDGSLHISATCTTLWLCPQP